MEKMIQDLKRQLLADKKKLGVVVGLLAVGLLLWGRLLLKEVPKTATAVPQPAAGASAAANGQDRADLPEDDDRYRVTVVMTMPTDLPRDVFALDKTAYRKAKSTSTRKYEPKPQADTPDKEFRVARAIEAARDLRLEGVIFGDDPSVIINGELLRQGQTIEGFTIHKIEERKVVLEMDGVHIRMSM